MASRKTIGTLALLLTGDTVGLAREFKRADSIIERSSKRWKREIKQGLKIGLGAVGVAGIASGITAEIRRVVTDIENIPGVPEDTVRSIKELRNDFQEARGVIASFVAEGVVGFAKLAQGIGYAAAAWEAGFKANGLLFSLMNPGASFGTGLGVVAANAPAVTPVDSTDAAATVDERKVQAALRDFFAPLDAASKAREDRLARLAESVFEKTRTPLEQFAEDMRELGQLVRGGLISFDTFDRRRVQLEEELRKATAAPAAFAPLTPRAPETDALGRLGLITGTPGPENSEQRKQTGVLEQIRDLLRAANARQGMVGSPIY